MQKPISAALAVIATIACLLGVVATSPSAHADHTPARVVGRTTGHTTVTVRVSGCNGCQVSASSWMRLHTRPWTSRVRTVRNGRVTFHPPTGRTRGLTFAFTDRHAVNDGAVPQTIMRYAGVRPGQDVTALRARRATGGYPCWAGTTARRATLRLTVDRYAGRAVDGTPGYLIRVYADPSVRSVGSRRHLHEGTYETQDIPLCIG